MKNKHLLPSGIIVMIKTMNTTALIPIVMILGESDDNWVLEMELEGNLDREK
jgi:hypothetical protein